VELRTVIKPILLAAFVAVAGCGLVWAGTEATQAPADTGASKPAIVFELPKPSEPSPSPADARKQAEHRAIRAARVLPTISYFNPASSLGEDFNDSRNESLPYAP
jgi:hypothetical protein